MESRAGELEKLTVDVGSYSFTGLAAGPPDGPLALLLHGWPEFASSWTQVLLAKRKSASVERVGLLILTLFSREIGQAVEGTSNMGVVWA